MCLDCEGHCKCLTHLGGVRSPQLDLLSHRSSLSYKQPTEEQSSVEKQMAELKK